MLDLPSVLPDGVTFELETTIQESKVDEICRDKVIDTISKEGNIEKEEHSNETIQNVE